MTICCFPNCVYLSETSRMIAVYRRFLAKEEKAIIATHGGTYEFILKEEKIPFHYVIPIMSMSGLKNLWLPIVKRKVFRAFIG